MTLGQARELIAGARVEGDERTAFRGLAYDSRSVAAGDLFFAVPGFERDGAAFVGEAVRRGAVAVVARGSVNTTAPRLLVSDVRHAMGRIAARFHGDPSGELLGVGVTGTNGKTTTAWLLAGILDAAGVSAGLLGTVAYRVGRSEEKAPRTTPEAPDLHRMLRAMRDAGNRAVALEVSSHAIALGRVAGLALEAMVFTNLTRDHLDFHGSMDAYYETKRRFFRREDLTRLAARVERAVINRDDEFGRRLAGETDLPTTTFGLAPGADVQLTVRERDLSGSVLEFAAPRGGFRCRLPLPGPFQSQNALAAVAAAEALALPRAAIVEGIEGAKPVPGRFQTIENGLGIHVIVDYAHTPDALEALLGGLRPLVTRRIISVFGCGGNRDRGKRPLMGRAVGGRSDLAVLTSDNPRREDPGAIIADVEPGLRESGASYVAVVDRREAIARALDEARPGDAVVIAGKGHEDYQEIGGERRPFADVDVARALLREREEGRRISHAGRG
jgi:UDP-N-acetylmuramoyl-L-alanyl-D-glutamate--2,6-diaminopimelate ligase